MLDGLNDELNKVTWLAGSLRVAYPRPVPEAVFESGPDYGGVTGLWALSARPGDESHAAVVLSFVSGSRTLSIAGNQACQHSLVRLCCRTSPAGRLC
jgi:hypothetical protein